MRPQKWPRYIFFTLTNVICYFQVFFTVFATFKWFQSIVAAKNNMEASRDRQICLNMSIS